LSDTRSPAAPRRIDALRVVSFGAFVAGNTTGLALADLGADVVKIEARARPDVLRMPAYGFGETNVVEPSGVQNTIMQADLARSMRNLSLDMEVEAGRALFRRLVAVSDVVVENFGAHTMEHWGCSFDDLLRINPRLVMVSLSGYGRTGPRAPYLAYATNISNFTGLTTTWGIQHGTHSDYIAAAHAVVGVLAAIAHVSRTGTGVHVDVAQIEALAAVMAPLLLDPLNNGHDTTAPGNVVPGARFSDVVACQGHDRWLAIELEDDADWTRLCAYLEVPQLASAPPDDIGAREELAAALGVWAADRSPHTAALLLQREGLAAEAVADNEDVVRDPQVRARGAAVELDQPDLGIVEYYQSPYRLSKTPGSARRAGARLGEHTHEVLREWLAIDDDELVALARADAVFQAPEE
jgi:crotonobetainyl-CoA:carnitine CoA-transferase CaiB-like acyl-CoA transferase